MTYELVESMDGTTTITVDFADEGVELEGITHVKGNTDNARSYLPVFEQDLRNNYSDIFPVQSPEPGEGE